MAFGPGVFLKMEQLGLARLLPEMVAVFEAEPCGKNNEGFSPDHTFPTPPPGGVRYAEKHNFCLSRYARWTFSFHFYYKEI